MKKFTSPKGTAGYTNLIRPDTKYDPDGVFKTTLTMPAEAAEELIDLMKEEVLEDLGKAKAAKAVYPVKENEDGTVTISFKTKATDKDGKVKKLPIFDGKGNPIRNTEDLNIGGGSVLKIKGAAKAYHNGSNIGCTLYINSVQVIKLVEYNGGGFDADDEADFVASNGQTSKRAPREEPAEEEEEDVNF